MKLVRDQWHIAYKFSSESKFHLIKNSASFWVADPFPIEYQGEIYLFAELYLYKKNKGVIAYSKYVNGAFTHWKIAIEEPWHLSFPFIIDYKGNLFLCPESYKSGKYYAYISEVFPYKWRRLDPIRDDGNLYVDSVFASLNNETYFFSYQMNPLRHSEGKLYLHNLSKNKFQSPMEIITPYPRPGGNILKNQNQYIRVAQNCDLEYGHGLVFFDICIGEDSYKEELIKKIYAEDIAVDSSHKFCGIHTFNSYHDFQVIDLKTKDINPVDLFYRITRRFIKAFSVFRKKSP